MKAYYGLFVSLMVPDNETAPVPFSIKRQASWQYTRPAKSESASNLSSALDAYSSDQFRERKVKFGTLLEQRRSVQVRVAVAERR